MGHLKEFKVPEKYSTKWLWDLIQQIRSAVNTMHDSNFPEEGLTGSKIVRDHTLPVKKLSGGEFHLPFVALGEAITTTDTNWRNVGGIVVYDPNLWGEVSALVFDVTGGPAGSGASASFRIVDSGQGELVAVTANLSGYSRYTATVPANKVPKTAQALLVQYKTSNASVAAGLVSARLIVRP